MVVAVATTVLGIGLRSGRDVEQMLLTLLERLGVTFQRKGRNRVLLNAPLSHLLAGRTFFNQFLPRAAGVMETDSGRLNVLRRHARRGHWGRTLQLQQEPPECVVLDGDRLLITLDRWSREDRIVLLYELFQALTGSEGPLVELGNLHDQAGLYQMAVGFPVANLGDRAATDAAFARAFTFLAPFGLPITLTSAKMWFDLIGTRQLKPADAYKALCHLAGRLAGVTIEANGANPDEDCIFVARDVVERLPALRFLLTPPPPWPDRVILTDDDITISRMMALTERIVPYAVAREPDRLSLSLGRLRSEINRIFRVSGKSRSDRLLMLFAAAFLDMVYQNLRPEGSPITRSPAWGVWQIGLPVPPELTPKAYEELMAGVEQWILPLNQSVLPIM